MSPLDVALLQLESPSTPIHVGSVSLVQGPVPETDDLARRIASRLHLVPRLRQLIRRVPGGLGRPVWVVFAYTVVGSMFFPFVIGTLLWLNGSGRVRAEAPSSRALTGILIAALALYVFLAVRVMTG